MIIGVDLEKDERVLYDAYNDAAGVTARFNLNVLVRINRELGGNFDLSAFTHRSIYNRDRHRIEMHLISRKAQSVRMLGHNFSFRPGESIHTENSYKYSLERFTALARGVGLDGAGVLDRRGEDVLGSRAGGFGLRVCPGPSPATPISHTATRIRIAVVAIDSHSGDRSLANQASTRKPTMPTPCESCRKPRMRVLEQDGSEQKQQGTADRAQHGPEIGMAGRMLQHQFIGDRRDNDAGDDRHVQIGVGEPRQPARLAPISRSVRSPASAPLWK